MEQTFTESEILVAKNLSHLEDIPAWISEEEKARILLAFEANPDLAFEARCQDMLSRLPPPQQ